VHIPRNLESGEVPLTESPLGRLEFKLSRILLTGSAELRSGCCSGMVLFDRSYRMNRPENCKQGNIKKGNKIYERQGYKDD
jgi:hypothetical protein